MEFHGTWGFVAQVTLWNGIEFRGIWVSKFWWKLYSIVPDELISLNQLTPYTFLQVAFPNWCSIINICIIPYAFPALLITYQNIIQNPFSILIETYFDQKIPWNFLQSSMELFEQHLINTRGSMEFHGIWATKPQVPWNSMEFCPDPKFHGIPSNSFHTPWNSMELSILPKKFHENPWNFFEVPWNSMELDQFHILKNHISRYCFWYLIDD